MEHELIFPALVPIRILHLLATNGVMTTAQVHEHITAGTLRTLRGVGPYNEMLITVIYTTARWHDIMTPETRNKYHR
jgi:hypothetical protein